MLYRLQLQLASRIRTELQFRPDEQDQGAACKQDQEGTGSVLMSRIRAQLASRIRKELVQS